MSVQTQLTDQAQRVIEDMLARVARAMERAANDLHYNSTCGQLSTFDASDTVEFAVAKAVEDGLPAMVRRYIDQR